MAKAIAEQLNRLSIFWLKKHWYIPTGGNYRYGGIQWTYGSSENKNSINFSVMTNGSEADHIRLRYTHTDKWTGEKNDMDYKIMLASTPCNYGKVRYWFICPLSKNGKYCGRRVGVIYGIDKWFGCRHCGEIAYQAQFEGGNYRAGSITELDVEKTYNEVKLKYYNGKITKKYQRYLRLSDKASNEWIKMAKKFGS